MNDSNVIIANLQVNLTQNLIHSQFSLKNVKVKKSELFC